MINKKGQQCELLSVLSKIGTKQHFILAFEKKGYIIRLYRTKKTTYKLSFHQESFK